MSTEVDSAPVLVRPPYKALCKKFRRMMLLRLNRQRVNIRLHEVIKRFVDEAMLLESAEIGEAG